MAQRKQLKYDGWEVSGISKSTNASPTQSSRVLPWRLVVILSAALALAAMGTGFLFGNSMVPAALAGMVLGFFGTVFASRWEAALSGVVAASAAIATAFVPGWMIPAVIAPALGALAGRESGQTGKRAYAFGIIAWIMLIAPASQHAPLAVLAAFAITLGSGVLLAVQLGAEARAVRAPAGRQQGKAHAIALAVGLSVSVILSWQFESASSSWIVTLFAVRALDAPGTHMRSAVRAGLATILGAMAAAAITSLPLPVPLFTALGLAFFLAGLRVLPSPGARSSVFMSAGVVLATAPNFASAIFRVEAATIAAILAVTLSLTAHYIQDRLAKSSPDQAS